MKKGRRLIRNTIVALSGVMVLYVGINRLYVVDESPASPRRTTVAELALLRDFDAIKVSGDFAIEVVQQSGYSVDFTPSDSSQGTFTAAMRGKTLVLRGFGDPPASRVRVGLPTLTQLGAKGVPALSISGFNAASLSLRLEGVRQVALRSNGIRQWHVVSSGSEVTQLQVDRASVGAGKVDLVGRVSLIVMD